MTTTLATYAQIAAIRKLITGGRYVYRTSGDEDLRSLIETGRVVISGVGDSVWSALGVAIEDRPETLAAAASNRAGVSLAAFIPGHWPSEVIPGLVEALEQMLPAEMRPLAVSAYGQTSWLERGLLNSGFEIVEQIVYMALDRIDQSKLALSAHEPIELRPVTLPDLRIIAQLDAATFAPLWHFGERQLWELSFRGRMQVAWLDGQIAGYSALLNNTKNEAQLARLAVLPALQNHGIGRLLTIDSILYCQQAGYRRLALNTQVSNTRAQTLYNKLGFRPFGDKIPVLLKNIQ